MNYQKIYEQIILRGKSRNISDYTESHHIIPKCLGGTNNSDNLVKLTAREHFICHYLLTKIYPDNTKLLYAYNQMFSISSNQDRYIPISKFYEVRRKLWHDNHPMKNPDTKARMIENLKKYNDKIRKSKPMSTRAVAKMFDISMKYCQCGSLKYLGANKCNKCVLQTKIDSRIRNGIVSKDSLEYNKKLAKIRKNYINENYDKICKINQDIAKNIDQQAKGRKIAQTKKKNGYGMSHRHKCFILDFYDDMNVLLYTKDDKTSLKEFCYINKDFTERRISRSYNTGNRITGTNIYARKRE